MPYVVELTPPGRGAIATVLVEGPQAIRAVAAHFRTPSGRPLSDYPPDQLVFGHFGPPPGEQVVLRKRSEEALELHCHGGRAAVAMIEQTLQSDGYPLRSWADWAEDRHRDPITAAARVALAAAPTVRTAAILLDQYRGALRREIDRIEQLLGAGNSQTARQAVQTLLSRAQIGLHLTRPWQVVLCGRPNVGKSSLINALAGYARAIVHPTPGTTRDVVSVRTALDGWPVEFSDTAGLHAGGGVLERAGIRRAEQKLTQADLVVLIFDRSVAWSGADGELLGQRPKAIVVENKSDLPAAGRRPAPSLETSALRGTGIEALIDAIAARLVPQPPPPGTAVPFTQEQVEQLGGMLPP